MFEGEITEQEICAYVGRHADSYLEVWMPALAEGVTPWKFKHPAFWLSCLWLGYRKMYKVLFIILGLIVAESVVEVIIFEGMMGMPETPTLMGAVIGLLVAIVCGNFGMGWYLNQARRVIMEVRALRLDEMTHLAELSRRGGTNVWAATGIFLLYMLVMFVVYLFLEMLILPAGGGGYTI